LNRFPLKLWSFFASSHVFLRLNGEACLLMLFHGEPSIQPDKRLSNLMLLMPKRGTAILVQDIKDILEKNPKTASCSKKQNLTSR